MNGLLATFDSVSAAWGCVGSIVYATLQLRARLCGGERDLSAHERRRAWAEALTVPLVGTPTAAALASAAVHWAPWLNGPGAAFAVGLLINPLWPALRDGAIGLIAKLGKERRP